MCIRRNRICCRLLAAGWAASWLVGLMLASGCGEAPQPNAAAPPAAADSPTPPASQAAAPEVTPPAQPASLAASGEQPSSEVEQLVAAQRAQREQLDKTLWKDEILAGRHGNFFVELWDRLRETKDRYSLLMEVKLPQVVMPEYVAPRSLSLGVEEYLCGEAVKKLSQDEFRQALTAWRDAGYELFQSEWHHHQFQAGTEGHATSVVEMALHVDNPSRQEKWIITADLHVHWQPLAEGKPVEIESLEVHELKAWKRTGPTPFRLAATLPVPTQAGSDAADFLAMYDLDQDGDAELIFGNSVFRNDGGGRFVAGPLSPHRQEGLQAAVLADFNEDGRVDLFYADQGASPHLLLADAQGAFTQPPVKVDIPPTRLCQAITAGDVNRDGHLDVWLTQYKGPYDGGQMPTPYYDANDGDPSYLLLGDGTGKFRDATESSGLAKKRFRRTYSASFVDLDDDVDLDLLVVSDFAGVDVYSNRGDGTFEDVSAQWLTERNNFGMSHTVDDFNGDGRLDIYVTGMASTTARRLEKLGIRHPEFDQHNKMRPLMGYGNRMYLGMGGKFEQPPYREQVARTGWSWGTTTIDLENDGDRDLFVGNGHISGKSAADYCSVFWRHDIYTGSSQQNPVLGKLFADVQQDFERNKGGSWNGFEHKCLLVQEDGQYRNLAHLLGVADEYDARAVVGNDIDSDGRMDLLVVESPRGRPAVLHVFRNHLELPHHWIGVRVVDRPRRSPLGARVLLTTKQGKRVAQIVSGDSFSSQHAAAVHFGLGDLKEVESLEIRFADGTVQRLDRPAVDQYHLVK